MLIDYIKKTGARRLIIMVLGNVFLGIGISIFKLSGLGTDPFSGMVMSLAACAGIRYAEFQMLFNLCLLAVEFLFGRRLIGAGTVVNACLLGYIVTFFYDIWLNTVGIPEALWLQVLVMCIGVVICSFGLSLYQTPVVGVAPFDSLSIIMANRWPRIPYFWYRMSHDLVAALVCYGAGGVVGVGTLVTALGLGPIAQLFTVKFTKKLLVSTAKK